MTRLLAFSFLAVTIFNPLSCQIDSGLFAKKLRLRPSEFGVQIDYGVAMQTSDGTILRADIYHPKTNEPKPTILVRIPFSNTLKNRYFSSVIAKLWAGRGYHVVMQGTRGQYKSEGEYYPLIPERQDGIDTLHWLAKQTWYDGRLGMWGGSYFGYTQWVLADQIDPGPSALMIQIASTEFYSMFYPGGAFSFYSALYWSVWNASKKEDFPTAEMLQHGFIGFPLTQADDRAFGDIPYFNDWVNHPKKDDYWLAIDGKDRAKKLVAPVLLMGGWYDPFLPTLLEDYEKIRQVANAEVATASRLMIGPWGHARAVTMSGGHNPRNYRLESLAPSIPWFDQHLLKRNDAELMQSPIKIFVMGKNIWREEKEWPLARIKYTPYYLRSNGKANTLSGDGVLSLTVPEKEEASDTYFYDPQNPVSMAGGAMFGPLAGIAKQNYIEARQDVLVYSTAPLEKDLEVTGPVKLILYVSTTAPSTDFTAKLVDVHPDGSAYNVCDGILRRSYSSSDKPTAIEINLWPTSMAFFKDHRIRLEVSSSNYPRFDRNPNTGLNIAMELEPIIAGQKIHHGSLYLSRLILPVIQE